MERVRLLFLCMAVMWISAVNLSAFPGGRSPDNFSLYHENGKVGLKDGEGQILIPATYDALGWSSGEFSIVDKVVGYRSDGLWGIIHTSNKVVTTPQFAELTPGEGSFLVAKKKSPLSLRLSYGVVNTGGKVIVPFSYDGLRLVNMRAVVMARTGTRFHFGLLDLSGNVVIPLEYQRIYSLGSLRFAVENFDHKTAIFSEDGAPLTGFLIDSISAFKNNYAILYQNQRQGVIDRDGRVVVSPTYSEIRVTDKGVVEGRTPDSWFFLDGKNTLLRQQSADNILPLSPERYAVTSGGKMQLMNNHFEPVCPAFFSQLSCFRNGIALFRNGGHTGALDTQGRIILPAEYYELIAEPDAFRVTLDNHQKNAWVLLDRSGQKLTAKHYEYIGPFNGKFYPVRNRGFWGAVNASGKEIISCVHDSLVQQAADYIVVKFKGQYGAIDMEENWVITPQPYPLEVLNRETYFEFAGHTTFLKSFSGNTIYFSDNRLSFNGTHIREILPTGACWLIDLKGIIVDRSRQPEGTEQVFPESEGLRAIRKDGKFGFIDEEGRLRIANRYEAVKPFSDGMAAIRILNQWGFIDHQEKLLVQPVYDEVENFVNGLAIVHKDGLSGLIDKKGKVVLPVRYDKITLNPQQRWRLQLHGLTGLADARGAVIIHPKYHELTDTGNGYVIVQRGGKFGLLTLGGVSTIPMIYDGLRYDPLHQQYLGLKVSPWQTVATPIVHGP